MKEIEIKLVDKNTNLSNVKPLDWDLVIKDRKYYVCRLDGYCHTIGGHYDNNCYWCYPRNEPPTYDNLLEFDGIPVRWGFIVEDNNYTNYKYGEGEVNHNHSIAITRNGENFFSFGSAGIAYGVGKAMQIIESIDEHPLDLNSIDYDKKMIGRKVWWHNTPAIIDRWIAGQACVILIPDGTEKFPVPAYFIKEGDEEEKEIKTDIFDKHIWWFRD